MTKTMMRNVGLAVGGLLVLVGCSTEHYRKSADKQAAAVIAEKSPAVPNMDPKFTIATNGPVSLDGLPVNTQVEEFLGPYGESERDAPILSLEKSLGIAVKHSRLYQSNKEQLYLAALSLTLSRHQFAPLFSAGGRANYAVDTQRILELVPDPDNPGQSIPLLSDRLVEEHRVSASGSVGVDWLIRDVGRISAAFTTDFLRFLTGDPRTMTSSRVGATFARPLLRNSGYKAEVESLTQAERDVFYELRDFVRFRKDFSVQIATAYYGVLRDRDTVRNSHLSLQNFKRTAERTRALAREGRTTQSDLGRLEQEELSTESTWINAVRAYKRSLDDFKIQLGIPVETRLVLDDRDLEQLTIQHVEISVEDSIKVALAARLDYQNLREQHEDAQRKVKLAADRLKAQLDFLASASFDSVEQSHGFPLPDPDRYRWNAGVDLNLPLERKAERNAYRSALISLDRSARTLEQRRDEIELQVRESHRTLEQARRTYEISEIGVKLAERRVEEQELLAQLGRAKAQDQVDTQNDLVRSLNDRTQALVGHNTARLEFWNNMGILYIKENGQWKDLPHEIRK